MLAAIVGYSVKYEGIAKERAMPVIDLVERKPEPSVCCFCSGKFNFRYYYPIQCGFKIKSIENPGRYRK